MPGLFGLPDRWVAHSTAFAGITFAKMTKLSKDYPSRGFPSRWISFAKTRGRLSINETAEPASWGSFRDVLLPYHPSNLLWAPCFDSTRNRLRPYFTTETYRTGARVKSHLMNVWSPDTNTAAAACEGIIGSTRRSY